MNEPNSPRFVSNTSVAASEIDNGMALLDLDRNIYFSLNQVGAVIWRAIEQPLSIDQICAIVADNFRTSPEACRGDIERLMGRLIEAKLAHEVGSATS